MLKNFRFGSGSIFFQVQVKVKWILYHYDSCIQYGTPSNNRILNIWKLSRCKFSKKKQMKNIPNIVKAMNVNVNQIWHSLKEGLKTNEKEHLPIVDDGPKVPCTTSLSGNCTRSTPVLYLNIANCTRHHHHLSCYSGTHKTVE